MEQEKLSSPSPLTLEELRRGSTKMSGKYSGWFSRFYITKAIQGGILDHEGTMET